MKKRVSGLGTLIELQKEHQIKETPKEVVVEVRCLYFKGTCRENLDKC
jgi:hypothetical protein